jgi:hypothetical protein
MTGPPTNGSTGAARESCDELLAGTSVSASLDELDESSEHAKRNADKQTAITTSKTAIGDVREPLI